MMIDWVVLTGWVATGVTTDYVADRYIGRRARLVVVAVWLVSGLLAALVSAQATSTHALYTFGVWLPLLLRVSAEPLLARWSRDIYRAEARRIVDEYRP